MDLYYRWLVPTFLGSPGRNARGILGQALSGRSIVDQLTRGFGTESYFDAYNNVVTDPLTKRVVGVGLYSRVSFQVRPFFCLATTHMSESSWGLSHRHVNPWLP